ncbi:alpha/beta fold hydrolase [Streptomyces sp. XH2]|uniref:alpha/beta fold hydrolase n=1 Tax=Streptomyces sp. XH2 TaxID=3412483 RepID=UPI003C79B50D
MFRDTSTTEGDVDATRQVIDAQDGPVVLVGHSYGGAVISEAGNRPKVSALVSIAAFAPDKGESVNTLIADPTPGAPVPPVLPPKDGFLLLDRKRFAGSFAGDLPAEQAAFLADSQIPWGGGGGPGARPPPPPAGGGPPPPRAPPPPAWRAKPSWYLVATHDRMIPPPAQRAMAERAGSQVVEVAGSHAISVSQPDEVAALIRQTAER